MKTAVIMAAGTGSRFGKHTKSIPKGFIEVCGKSMIISSIERLIAAGVEEIIIGTGHHREYYENLAKDYPLINCCFNERYQDTNSMQTLYDCRRLIKSDFLLLESDLIYEDRALTELIKSDGDTVVLAASLSRTRDEYFIEAGEGGLLVNLSTNKNKLNHVSGEFVGIHKVSLRFYRKMCEIAGDVLKENPMVGYEYIIKDASKYLPCAMYKIDDLVWHEIDDEVDLLYAEQNICPKLAGK